MLKVIEPTPNFLRRTGGECGGGGGAFPGENGGGIIATAEDEIRRIFTGNLPEGLERTSSQRNLKC